jgi:uncharacterized protein (DUF4415 family)
MPRERREPAPDEENPEWTAEDFARARPAHEVLSAEVLSAFRKTRGPQRSQKKVPVSIRLSADVVEHFKATGPGWQRRIDETLKEAAGLAARNRTGASGRKR